MSNHYTRSSFLGTSKDDSNDILDGDVTFAPGSRVIGDIIPKATCTYNLGSAALRWNTVFACKVEVDDANFNLDINGSDPTITFDSGDFMSYIRGSDEWRLKIGSNPNPDLIVSNGLVHINNKLELADTATFINKDTSGPTNNDVSIQFATNDFWYFDSSADTLALTIASGEVVNYQANGVRFSKDILSTAVGTLDVGDATNYWAHFYGNQAVVNELVALTTNLTWTGDLLPSASLTYNIGSSANRVATIFANRVNTNTLAGLSSGTIATGTLEPLTASNLDVGTASKAYRRLYTENIRNPNWSTTNSLLYTDGNRDVQQDTGLTRPSAGALTTTANITAGGTFVGSYENIVTDTSGSQTISDNVTTIEINDGTAAATFTLNGPATPIQGQIIYVHNGSAFATTAPLAIPAGTGKIYFYTGLNWAAVS